MLKQSLRNIAMLSALMFVGHAGATDEQASLQWQFDVLLDGKRIGYQTFDIQQDGATQVLTTEASFDVKFLFVTAFRYRHNNTEVWNEGCLSRIDAETDSNGKKFEVRGERADDGFKLESSQGSAALPACVQTFAYWNPTVLESPRLLNTQTGAYEEVSVTPEGPDEITVAGDTVEALRYRLSVKGGDITLWYSASDNTWLGLEAPAKGGRKILYQAAGVPTLTAEMQAKLTLPSLSEPT